MVEALHGSAAFEPLAEKPGAVSMA